jgi:hypothetical protein
MTKRDAQTLIAGMLHDGIDPRRLSKEARREIRVAIYRIIELTEAK